MIRVTASSPDFQRIARQFHATEAQIHSAIKKAVARTTKWAAAEAPRRVAKAVSVAAKIIKDRVRFTIILDRDGYGRVWFGLNQISLGKLNPRQSRSGVTVGGRRIPGAFLATMPNGHMGVYVRRGNQRLPIDEQMLAIEDEAKPVIEALGDELGPRCLHEFERELRWQTLRK